MVMFSNVVITLVKSISHIGIIINKGIVREVLNQMLIPIPIPIPISMHYVAQEMQDFTNASTALSLAFVNWKVEKYEKSFKI